MVRPHPTMFVAADEHFRLICVSPHQPLDALSSFFSRVRKLSKGGWRGLFKRKHPLKPNTLARIQAGLRKFGLNPFLVQPGHASQQGKVDNCRSTTLEHPLGTLPCSNRFALIEPFLIELHGTSPQHIANSGRNLNEPLGCVTAGGRHFGLVEPILSNNEEEIRQDSLKEELSEPEIPVLNPYLIHCNHTGSERIRSLDTPLPTVCGNRGEIAFLEPYLIKYFGTGTAACINDPLATVTTRDRFGLVMPVLEIKNRRYTLDILFRMLEPEELAAAQGVQARRNRTQRVRQIGNAVTRRIARALIATMLTQNPDAPQYLWEWEQENALAA